jgi:ABC-type lipoprotein release transport system permease subunit
MYKLFLTLRYLTRKKIVIFPILVVWLCLMMMIIVTSIMGGFVEHVKQSNRDLLGDIVISVRDPSGWARYEELQKLLTEKVPELQTSTPVIHSFGLISANGAAYGVEIVGVDPVGRAQVSKFRETLYHQYISPNAAADALAKALPATGEQLQHYSEDQLATAVASHDAASIAYEAIDPFSPPPPHPDLRWLWGIAPIAGVILPLLIRRRRTIRSWSWAIAVFAIGGTVVSLGTAWPVIFPTTYAMAKDAVERTRLDADQKNDTADFAASLPQKMKFTTRAELAKQFVPKGVSFDVPANVINGAGGAGSQPVAKNGCIIGSQLLFNRDKRGNFIRDAGTNYKFVKLTVVPVPPSGVVHTISADTRTFTIIDDSYTGVADVDTTYVYASFDIVQAMAGMRIDDPDVKPGSDGWFAPRCSELLIRLKPNISQEQMYLIRDRIDKLVVGFQAAHPDAYDYPLNVQTWDDKQKKYLDAVENEKVMQEFILGLMSCVVLVVVFLIFYMIVRDKTRDIGIIKAVGGSEEGVAMIFLAYGLFIGIVGGVLGMISGVEFVLHTNEIHEFIFRMTGRVIWDRSVYMFDEIPHTVNPHEVAWYFVAALIAGVIGALIPAIVAGSEDPVKAVRYE